MRTGKMSEDKVEEFVLTTETYYEAIINKTNMGSEQGDTNRPDHRNQTIRHMHI